MHEVDIAQAIVDYMAEEAITQDELAQRAKVSQTTVSRALRRTPQRQGRAYLRLVIYMQQQRSHSAAPDEALSAVNDVWDGSEAHAAALARLVFASRELWPKLRGA